MGDRYEGRKRYPGPREYDIRNIPRNMHEDSRYEVWEEEYHRRGMRPSGDRYHHHGERYGRDAVHDRYHVPRQEEGGVYRYRTDEGREYCRPYPRVGTQEHLYPDNRYQGRREMDEPRVEHGTGRPAKRPHRHMAACTPPSKAIGIFGLSVYATEDDVKDFLREKIRGIENYRVIMVYDKHRRMSKGYGFIYFDTVDDAISAKGRLTGQMIKGKEIRVDYAASGSLVNPENDAGGEQGAGTTPRPPN